MTMMTLTRASVSTAKSTTMILRSRRWWRWWQQQWWFCLSGCWFCPWWLGCWFCLSGCFISKSFRKQPFRLDETSSTFTLMGNLRQLWAPPAARPHRHIQYPDDFPEISRSHPTTPGDSISHLGTPCTNDVRMYSMYFLCCGPPSLTSFC